MDLVSGQLGDDPITRGEHRLHAVCAVRLKLTLQGRFQVHLDQEQPRLRHWHWLYSLKQPDQQVSGCNDPRTGLGTIVGRLSHDLEEAGCQMLGSAQERWCLDLPVPAQAGQHLLVGVQYDGICLEAPVALASELRLEQGEQVPVQTSA